ncbi:hypothetical protein FRC02_001692 [Tulasnella sp. 418]|nr:hypothetical protein FRC02_001692 [Tulasnella sp. 418]
MFKVTMNLMADVKLLRKEVKDAMLNKSNGDASDEDSSRGLVGCRSLETNQRQSDVRKFAARLLGVQEHRVKGRLVRNPLPHSPQIKDGDQPCPGDPFRLVWESPISSEWNSVLAVLFTTAFLRDPEHQGGGYTQEDFEDIAATFCTHFEVLRRRYKLENEKHADSATQAARKKALRTKQARKERRCRALQIVQKSHPAYYAKMEKHFSKLGVDGMSSDEEVETEGHTPRTYHIFTKDWRAPELIKMLRDLDLIHQKTRDSRGSSARTRVHDPARISSRDAISGLPRNFYSKDRLEKHKDDDYDMFSLNIQEEEVDFMLPPMYRFYSKNGSAVEGEEERPSTA